MDVHRTPPLPPTCLVLLPRSDPVTRIYESSYRRYWPPPTVHSPPPNCNSEPCPKVRRVAAHNDLVVYRCQPVVNSGVLARITLELRFMTARAAPCTVSARQLLGADRDRSWFEGRNTTCTVQYCPRDWKPTYKCEPSRVCPGLPAPRCPCQHTFSIPY